MSDTLKVVDPHIHLWDLRTGLYPHFEKPRRTRFGSNAAIARNYLLEEFLEEGQGDVEVLAAVHVEAFPKDALKEVESLQKVADGSPIPLAIVGHADLTSPGFPALLDRQAALTAFRGIRQVVNTHPDPELSVGSCDLIAVPAFLDGLKLLGDRGFSFDLQLYPHQMDAAARLASQAPQTQFILDHAGMWTDFTLDGWKTWKAGMRKLAALPNMGVKISGLSMRTSTASVESMRPIVFETLEAFGPARAMFASNFPVDKLKAEYPALWRAFDTITSDFSSGERGALFRENALRYYRFSQGTR
ncbi:amidohydrolase family protein [Chelativorans sp.]|uniref:amidohydrolase family protein n=1 Tax=Chelativorans sp. TaxID=2203393 RepID=UPI002810BEC5|nr:amidohydrolase family protein [Chelativorans sp.]